MDGYNTSKKFLTARSPSKQLISSFWKMVAQEKIHSIVLLDQEQDKVTEIFEVQVLNAQL